MSKLKVRDFRDFHEQYTIDLCNLQDQINELQRLAGLLPLNVFGGETRETLDGSPVGQAQNTSPAWVGDHSLYTLPKELTDKHISKLKRQPPVKSIGESEIRNPVEPSATNLFAELDKLVLDQLGPLEEYLLKLRINALGTSVVMETRIDDRTALLKDLIKAKTILPNPVDGENWVVCQLQYLRLSFPEKSNHDIFWIKAPNKGIYLDITSYSTTLKEVIDEILKRWW